MNTPGARIRAYGRCLETLWLVHGSGNADASGVNWSSPGFVDTFHLMKEGVFHAESKEPEPDGIQGSDCCASASWAQL